MSYNNFSPEIIDKLQDYVYRLIDPRNGETFYVGKGKGNRVFDHIKMKTADGDEIENKIKRIREIESAGFEVAHIIHRHGMTREVAIQVEAALIDAYPGLTNSVVGNGSNDFGIMHAKEIIDRYTAVEANFQHNVMIICVNKNSLMMNLYDATNYCWRIDPNKARKMEYILANVQGIIKGVYVANEWLPATDLNFPGRGHYPNRYGFIGQDAPQDIRDIYLSKRIPDKYRKKGAANPIRYVVIH